MFFAVKLTRPGVCRLTSGAEEKIPLENAMNGAGVWWVFMLEHF